MVEGKTLSFRTAALVAGALGLASCGGQSSSPGGQVVARVGKTEITRSQLDLEMTLLNVPPDQRKEAAPVILAQMVDRTLFAQAAQDASINQNPRIVMMTARARDGILAQAYLSQVAAGARSKPRDSEIDEFVQNHPQIGPDRQILKGTVVKFLYPGDAGMLAAIRAAKTQDDLIAALNQRNIKFEQQPAVLDTAVLPDDILNAIGAVAPGEPAVIISGKVAQALIITDRVAQPLTPDQQREVATRRIEGERVDQAVDARRKSMRMATDISYSPGYAPPPDKPVSAPTATPSS